jgi:hypothetical protein
MRFRMTATARNASSGLQSSTTSTNRRVEMKTFEVELQRTSYVTVTVEAENEDDAEALAWKKIEQDCVNINDSHWSLESIEEVFS